MGSVILSFHDDAEGCPEFEAWVLHASRPNILVLARLAPISGVMASIGQVFLRLPRLLL